MVIGLEVLVLATHFAEVLLAYERHEVEAMPCNSVFYILSLKQSKHRQDTQEHSQQEVDHLR